MLCAESPIHRYSSTTRLKLLFISNNYIQSVKLAARLYTLRLLLKDVEIIPSRLAEKAGMISCCLEAREDYLFNRILD